MTSQDARDAQRARLRDIFSDLSDEDFDDRYPEAMEHVAAAEVMIGFMANHLFGATMLGGQHIGFAIIAHAEHSDWDEPMNSFQHPFEDKADLATFLRLMADEAERSLDTPSYHRTISDPAALVDFLPGDDIED